MAEETKALTVNVDSFANDFKTDLRDLLRASIARVMPQEMLDGLVRSSIDEFLKDKTAKTDNWGHRTNDLTQPSGLKQVVWELMKVEAAKAVSVYLQTPEWRAGYVSDNKEKIGEKLKEMIIELGPQLLLSMFGAAIGDHIIQIQNRLNTLGMNRSY